MSYSQSHMSGNDIRFASGPRMKDSVEVLVQRLRLAIGVAAVLLLVVFAALGERSAPDSVTDISVSETVTPSEPANDNRGKWGGYAH